MYIDKRIVETPIITLKKYKLFDRSGVEYKLRFPYTPIIKSLKSYAISKNMTFDELIQYIINHVNISEFTLNNILSNNELYCLEDVAMLFRMMGEPTIFYWKPINK